MSFSFSLSRVLNHRIVFTRESIALDSYCPKRFHFTFPLGMSRGEPAVPAAQLQADDQWTREMVPRGGEKRQTPEGTLDITAMNLHA